MDPNAPQGFPMQAGYPVPVSQSPQGQQFPYYPTPIPSYPPQKPPTPSHPQQHPFGALPMQPGGPMMPAGFPQQASAPHANFSAPFAHSAVPPAMAQFLPPQATSSAAYPPSTVAAPPQNMPSMPANNVAPGQPQKPASSSTASPAPPQPAAQASSTAARDKARVATLLDINSMLLQEVLNLQSAGKAGAPQPAQQGSQDSQPSPAGDNQAGDAAKGQGQKPSQEYIDCMRRLQYNLAYLATFADRSKKTGSAPPAAPAIMTPPPHLTSMNEIYQRLAELFPRAAPGAGGASQPSPQASQGNGRPSPSPATDPAA